MNKRETKLDNEIIFNLFKEYSVMDIKFLISIINRLLTKHKALQNENSEEKIEVLELGISLDFFRNYKGKKNLTLKEILEIIKKINSYGILIYEDNTYKRINIIKETEYNEKYKSVKIHFNDSALEYLIYVRDNFTLIDLNEIKDLNSKYEMGLYLLIRMFRKTGVILKTIPDLKKYFAMECENKILFNNLRIAALKLENKFGFKIKFEYKKVGKKIDRVIINFFKEG